MRTADRLPAAPIRLACLITGLLVLAYGDLATEWHRPWLLVAAWYLIAGALFVPERCVRSVEAKPVHVALIASARSRYVRGEIELEEFEWLVGMYLRADRSGMSRGGGRGGGWERGGGGGRVMRSHRDGGGAMR